MEHTIIELAVTPINDDPFTNSILARLGNLCVATINHERYVTFDLPESTDNLVIYDSNTEEWAPVIGAFTDDHHLYIIITTRNGLYIFSPTAPYETVVRYIRTETFQSEEYHVNPLAEDEIAIISPL